MSTPGLLVFGAAVSVLLCAHIVRAIRHSLLFAKGELPERFGLLLALSVSYALNAIVPLRIGEGVRALFIAVRLRLRVPYVLATVVAERFTDIVAVSVIACLLALTTTGGASALLFRAATLLAAAACAITAGAVLVRRVTGVRRAVWHIASVFNEAIRLAIVEFVWTVAGFVTEGRLRSARYIVATIGMWTLYLAAYSLFAIALGTSLGEVSLLLLGAPLRPLIEELLSGGISPTSVALVLFTSVPVLVVILYGFIRHRGEIERSLGFAKRFGLVPAELARTSIWRRFRNTSDYSALLAAHFTASRQIVSAFAGEGMDDIIVHRILPGGSDAVTAVVEVHGDLTIRKLATGDSGRKLSLQVEWLRTHASALPLPAVLHESWHGERFHYDMPFTVTANDFYDVIHTSPIESSRRVLREIVDEMTLFHERHDRGRVTNAVVDQYLETKVRANARAIREYAGGLLKEEYAINEDEYRLSDWDCLLDLEWLRRQVPSRRIAVIHGDLTIENIIASPSHERRWYLIDPNPSNILDTPLIDWAKLMQSLHLGYEGLNRGSLPTLSGDEMRLPLTRSSAYADLHRTLLALLSERLTPHELREVAFHELVNYLRLIPYRIRQSPQKAMAFFGCASILLREYAREADA
jgi:hypothetical protein